MANPRRARSTPGASARSSPSFENRLRQIRPSGRAAGHRHAARAEQLRQRVSRLTRRSPAGVEADRPLAVAQHDREQVATRATLVGLGDRQHPGRGQRRVHRVAAGLERPHTGGGRQRLAGRHHSAHAGGRGAIGRGRPAHAAILDGWGRSPLRGMDGSPVSVGNCERCSVPSRAEVSAARPRSSPSSR